MNIVELDKGISQNHVRDNDEAFKEVYEKLASTSIRLGIEKGKNIIFSNISSALNDIIKAELIFKNEINKISSALAKLKKDVEPKLKEIYSLNNQKKSMIEVYIDKNNKICSNVDIAYQLMGMLEISEECGENNKKEEKIMIKYNTYCDIISDGLIELEELEINILDIEKRILYIKEEISDKINEIRVLESQKLYFEQNLTSIKEAGISILLSRVLDTDFDNIESDKLNFGNSYDNSYDKKRYDKKMGVLKRHDGNIIINGIEIKNNESEMEDNSA